MGTNMAIKKDKQKVLGEVFDDARVKSFLNVPQRADTHHSFDILEKAYRGMNIDNFITFLSFFTEAEHDINAINADSKTFLHVISEHKHAAEYIDAIKNAGAAY